MLFATDSKVRPLSKPRTLWWLVLSLGLLITALCLHLLVFSRVHPVDFLVYRYAVSSAFDGANVYAANLFGPLMPENGLPYTYTPFALLALAPTVLFSPAVNFALWSALTILAFIWCMWKMIPKNQRRIWLVPVLVLAASTNIVVSHHLHFGQINVFLMVLVLFDATRSDASPLTKFLPRGVLVGIAAAIKLTPGLFILFFLVTKQWRLFWASTLSLLACTALGALIFPQMTLHFFADTLWQLGSRVSLTGDLGTSGNNSITGLFSALGEAPKAVLLAVLLLSATVFLAAATRTHARGKFIESWLIIGLSAPLLSPVSWIHHWVYLLPALCLILTSRAFLPRTRPLAAIPALLLILGPDSGQWLLSVLGAWSWPVAAIFRQSLMVASLLLIFWLQRPQPISARGKSCGRQETRVENASLCSD